MAQIKKGSGHGLAFVQVALVAQTGEAYGQAGPSAAAGTTTHAYLIRSPQEAGLTFPDRTTIDFTGGDRWLGSYQYGITSLGSFSLTIDAIEADLIALTTGSTVDQTTNAIWTLYGENVLASELPQVSVLITFRMQSRETGTDGGSYFISYIIDRAWMAPKGLTGAPSFQSRGMYEFQMTPTSADKMPTGLAFGTNQSFEDNKTPVVAIISDNPLGLTTFVHDGSTTQWNLGYRPIATDVTSTNGTNHYVQDGTQVNVTSVSLTDGEVTTTAATSGLHSAMLYETGFVATA